MDQWPFFRISERSITCITLPPGQGYCIRSPPMMTIKITVPITAPCWNCADLPLVAGSGQAPVQLIRSANQREVGKRLRKIPQVFAAWPQLRSVQAQMLRIAEGLLENEARLFQVTGPGQALDIPKRAHRKGALLAYQAILEGVTGLIAIDQGVGD